MWIYRTPWLWTHWYWRDDRVPALPSAAAATFSQVTRRSCSWLLGESCVAVWPTSFPAAFPCHLLGYRFPRNTLVALVARGKLQDSPRVWRFGRFTSLMAPKLDASPTSAMSHHYEANIHQRPNSGLKSQTDLNCMLAFDQFYPWEILISHIFSHLIPDLINLILKFLHFLGLCGIFQRQIFRLWFSASSEAMTTCPGLFRTGGSRKASNWSWSSMALKPPGMEMNPQCDFRCSTCGIWSSTKGDSPKWQEQESRNY